MKTAAERLKYARSAEGLSQEALAELAGVAQGTIGNMESGIRGKQSPSWPAVADALKRHYQWLRYGKGPEHLSGHTRTNSETAPTVARDPTRGTGATLASLCLDRRLTARDLANHLQVSDQRAARLISGDEMLTLEQRKILGAIFQMDPSQITDAAAVTAQPVPGNARKCRMTLNGYEFQLIQQYRHLPESAQHVLRAHAALMEETFAARSAETPFSRIDPPGGTEPPIQAPTPDSDYGSW